MLLPFLVLFIGGLAFIVMLICIIQPMMAVAKLLCEEYQTKKEFWNEFIPGFGAFKKYKNLK